VEETVAQLTEDLSQLREQFSELAERVDFTERALADVRRRDALQNPRS
jgi:predicted nuclease with TOPRIM domain